MKVIRLVLALAALALIAAGCGGAARAGSNSNSSEGTADDQLLAFTRCMREHGVDVEADSDGEGRMRIAIGAGANGGSDEDGGGKGAPDPKVEEAMKACEDKMPKMGQDLTPEERAELEDQMLEFAKCMREHGVDMPDPGEGGFIQKFDSSGDGVNRSGPDPESEEFKAAEEACKDKLPGKGFERGVSREEAN